MKIRDELLVETLSYANNTPAPTDEMLDCSLGTNPYGFPDSVREAFAKFDVEKLYQYPHSHEMDDAIIEYWKEYADLTRANITRCDGSISGLYMIFNIFAKNGAEVVGYIPTFTDACEYVRKMGMKYVPVELKKEDNYKQDADALLNAINEDTCMVYIDRPNNPTGQTFPLDSIKKVLDKCKAVNAYALIDEAYADFIPREESAMKFFNEYDNMIVIKTFSKGFGLAGMRAGYILSNPDIANYMSKISNPYLTGELAREMAAATLKSPEHGTLNAETFADIKKRMVAVMGDKMKMAETDPRVPLCMMYSTDPNVNLQKEFYEHNIVTCSGSDFEPLDASSVRARIPREEDAEQLINAIKSICE